MKLSLYLLPLLLSFSCSARCAPNASYIHFQLVQTWPPTFCLTSLKCKIPRPKSLTLHGLWPADANGNTVKQCSNTSQTAIEAMVNQEGKTNLKTAWPSILANWNNTGFWTHQWDKHGSCAESKIALVDYFRIAVERGMKVNLLDIIQAANITPSNQTNALHSKSDIQKVVKKVIGNHDVYVSCRLHANETLLFEIYISLDDNSIKYICCPKRSDKRVVVVLIKSNPTSNSQPNKSHVTKVQE